MNEEEISPKIYAAKWVAVYNYYYVLKDLSHIRPNKHTNHSPFSVFFAFCYAKIFSPMSFFYQIPPNKRMKNLARETHCPRPQQS